MVRKKIRFKAEKDGKPCTVEFKVHKKPKKPIQVRLPEGTIAEIDKSVKTGKFMNRSDFIRDSIRKADEKKIDTLEKGLRNLSEHDNLAPRLLKIEKDIRFLKIHHWLNFIFLIITICLFTLLGGMLL